MGATVSVVIPTLDEEPRIAATIDSAFAAGAAEVLVCDGGSRDATIEVARNRGATILTGETMRARQMNRGADAASGTALIFLHADTELPARAAELVTVALERCDFGGFRLEFRERSPQLRLAAALINARSSITRCPWGDQAPFIRRDRFLADGGFREIPIMEDYDLAVRMKRRGRTAVLPQKVVTSGRRFIEKGVMRTAFTNWRIVAAWRRGADPESLARMYRGR
jgi:uncharacterized protein